MQRAVVFGPTGDINPAGEGLGGVGEAPRCRSALLRTGRCLRALDGARSAGSHTASPSASLSQSEARRQALP